MGFWTLPKILQCLAATGLLCKAQSQSYFPARFWIIYSDAGCLNKSSLFIPSKTVWWFVCGFSLPLLICQPPWNRLAVKGGVKVLFLGPNHSILSAPWTFLINHKTMFHYLGISVSRSLKHLWYFETCRQSAFFLILEKPRMNLIYIQSAFCVLGSTLWTYTMHKVLLNLFSTPHLLQLSFSSDWQQIWGTCLTTSTRTAAAVPTVRKNCLCTSNKLFVK